MDKILENALRKERVRQEANIELIASENYVSNDILKLQGSILTNKYADITVVVNTLIYLKIQLENMLKSYLELNLLMFNHTLVQVLIWLCIELYLIMVIK